MNLLVTGINGLLGCSLKENLPENINVYSLQKKKSKNFKKNFHDVKCDLENFNENILPNKIDIIIHLAQSKNYKNFPESADDIFNVNVISTFKLLNFARKNKVKYFLFASTGDVLFENTLSPYQSFYTTTKLVSEKIISNYSNFFKISVLRLFGLYGRNQSKGLIYNLKEKILNNDTIFTNGDGNGDLIHMTHIDDCSDLINYFIKNKIVGTFDVAPPRRISIKKIADIMSNKYNKKVKIKKNINSLIKVTKPNLNKLKKIYDINNFRLPSKGIKEIL
jgi:UDP-glucose 4-epimerase